MPQKQIHFLTGRLAENALRNTLAEIAASNDIGYTIQVMPITVAALMTTDWIARKVQIPGQTELVIIPGYCKGELEPLTRKFGIPFQRGPKDVRRLPEYFGGQQIQPDLKSHSIEIIAEINHVPAKPLSEVVEIAKSFHANGADIIDVGCIPGETCLNIGDYVQSVRDAGMRVSIDSLNVKEIEIAVQAGAELVLSVNATNRDAAADWGSEVVVIPDNISDIDSMTPTIELLESAGVAYRLDPILEPIGLGFADSLMRYHRTRSRWPNAKMMMGIGNLTELSDVDSAGVNFLLLGFCQELNIESVLTTEVINWSRSSVAECNKARRIVHYACENRVPPKNLSEELVVLRDARRLEFPDNDLQQLADQIKDNNIRIFADANQLHLLGAQKRFSNKDPFNLFDQLAESEPGILNASHSFYLGYELCKAMIAMQLGKNYTQDEALNWGHLTVGEENRHRLSKRFRKE